MDKETLSDDKQFKERLAIEVSNRFSYQAHDAWQAYLKKNKNRYKDYTVERLSKCRHEWQLYWMVTAMSESLANITATLTDLLGVSIHLRKLAQADNLEKCDEFLRGWLDSPGLKKQAD